MKTTLKLITKSDYRRASLAAYATWRATGDSDFYCDAVYFARIARGMS